jgi:exosome complex component RRP46
MQPPQRAQLSHLSRADGSATFSHGGYTVVGSANGPMEVNRRDEDPFAAVIDVIVRPAAGVGGLLEVPLCAIGLAA